MVQKNGIINKMISCRHLLQLNFILIEKKAEDSKNLNFPENGAMVLLIPL